MSTERKKQQQVERLHGFLSEMISWLQYLNVNYPDERPLINDLIARAQKEMMDE